MKKRRMFLAALMVTASVVSMTGCGNLMTAKVDEVPETEETTETEEETGH